MKKFALLGVSLLTLAMCASVNAAAVADNANQNPNANIKQNVDEDFPQFNQEDNQQSARNNKNDNDEFAELDSKDKTLQDNTKYAWNNAQDNDPDQIDEIVQGKNTESDVGGFAD